MKIYDYMTARAKQEGKRHTLPRKQYKRWVEEGVRSLFGVLVDEFGTPISDQQNTVFFEEWQVLNKPASGSTSTIYVYSEAQGEGEELVSVSLPVHPYANVGIDIHLTEEESAELRTNLLDYIMTMRELKQAEEPSEIERMENHRREFAAKFPGEPCPF